MDDAASLSQKHTQVTAPENEPRTKDAAPQDANHGVPTGSGLEDCSICLQSITERAVAVPCNHLTFDFVCLVAWLQQRETCPLCNGTVTAVQYDWRSPSDYKSFEVASQRGSVYQSRARFGQISRQSGFRHSSGLRYPARNCHVDPALEKRRRVYQRGTYSLHVGANNISGYRDFAPQEFSGSTSLQSRARMFLRRELQVFAHLDPDGGSRNREFLREYIVAVMKKLDPKGADGRAEDLLSEFVGRSNARLLLHELNAWLRSPFRTLETWDRIVQYKADLPEPPLDKDG